MVKKLSKIDRFSIAIDKLSGVKCLFEELRDEYETWLENLPENLQNSSKAENIQSNIDVIEEIVNELENVELMELVE